MSNIKSFREKLHTLLAKFEKDKTHYLSKGYPEAQVRIDFLKPFFKALDWDIENKAQKPPYEIRPSSCQFIHHKRKQAHFNRVTQLIHVLLLPKPNDYFIARNCIMRH